MGRRLSKGEKRRGGWEDKYILQRLTSVGDKCKSFDHISEDTFYCANDITDFIANPMILPYIYAYVWEGSMLISYDFTYCLLTTSVSTGLLKAAVPYT